MWPPSKSWKSTTSQSLLCRCFSEAVNVRGKSMQAVEPCVQEAPLKEVLMTLGLVESDLTDLHDVSGVQWRLNLQSGKPFDSFCVFFFGVAVSHFWEVAKIETENFSNTTKLAIEICQQRRLPSDLRPRWGVSQPPRKGCKVVEISLREREEVTGTLSPRFSELPDLRELNLRRTEVSGDLLALENLKKLKWLYLSYTKVFGNISALKNLRKLQILDLRKTNVIGDMSSLRSTSLEDDFNIKGTKITCEDAALRAVLRSLGLQAEQLTDLMNFEGVKRMLSNRNMKVFLIWFLHMIWWIKLDHAWPEWPDHVLFAHVGWFSDTLILLTWAFFRNASSIFV